MTTWDEAMHLPGSAQLSLGKRLLEEYPWQQFAPHPEWAGFAQEAPGSSGFEVPYAAGIPDLVRIIYVPRKQPVVIGDLGRQAGHRATLFDPVTGARTSLGLIHADDQGNWTCLPPAGDEPDWVLILEPVAGDVRQAAPPPA
jgi:hypothetical protein